MRAAQAGVERASRSAVAGFIGDRTSVPVAAAAALGGVAWSGFAPLIACAAFAPFLIVATGGRAAVGARALAYYAGATWPIVPAAGVFFGEGQGALVSAAWGVGLWLALSAVNAAAWMIVSPRTPPQRVASVLVALTLTAVPPIGILGLASPLTATGWWLPGTGLLGGVVFLLVVASWIAVPSTRVRAGLVVVIGVFAIALNVRLYDRPARVSTAWAGAMTRLGGGGGHDASPISRESEAIESLRRTVAISPATVVVYSEAYVTNWSAASEQFLAPLFQQLATHGRSVLLGVMRTSPLTGLRDNLVVLRGAAHGELLQHVPVPVSLYRLGAEGSVPLRLSAPWTLAVGDERVGVLICWEQLLVGAALAMSLERPDRLVGVSNLYFARAAPVARIQAAAMQSWSRWLGIPVTLAVNE